MYTTKVYVVQAESGEVVGCKLTHLAAHMLAKLHAPARVLAFVADKQPPANAAPEGAAHGPRRHYSVRNEDV